MEVAKALTPAAARPVAEPIRRASNGSHGAAIDIADYLEAIVARIASGLPTAGNIALRADFQARLLLPLDKAVPLGLIVGELATNAIKYAHPAGVAGVIAIRTSRRNGAIAIELSDDGVGLPDGLDPLAAGGAGLSMIRALAAQLGAALSFDNHGLGLRCALLMPYAVAAAPPGGAGNYFGGRRPSAGRALSLGGGSTVMGELSPDFPKEAPERKLADEHAQRLASIVESSDDAIISKDLNGIIASWNRGAQRIFGYAAEEIIGKPVTVLIPPERENEEPGILERIRRGERIDHYETVRRRKDGSLVDISLTVSPIRNAAGEIIGASKVGRDITERRRARDQQQLLLREMDHRVKNLFSLAASVVTLSARSAASPAELAASVSARLGALARAHALTLSVPSDAASTEPPTTLHALVRTIVSPYENRSGEQQRVSVAGADVPLSHNSVTSLALLLHEFTTNAAKYGALSTAEGRIEVTCEVAGDKLLLKWNERGSPALNDQAGMDGFGAILIRSAIEGQLGGTISRDWLPEGLSIGLSLALDRLAK